MKSSKYKKPEEFFKYLIEEFGYSIFNDQQKCLAIASDMFEGDKQVTFLIKTTFNNNVFIELMKARNSSTENKLICIQRAIKILTDDCGTDKEKAKNVVGWLASVIYPNEWNTFLNQSISNEDNNDKVDCDQLKPNPIITPEKKNNQINKNNIIEEKNWTLEEIKLEMIYCPAGSFMMGSPSGFLGLVGCESGRNNDEILHEVIISKAFMIGKYLITQNQYKTVMGVNPSRFKGYKEPVETVSWEEAKEFCKRINSIYKNSLPDGYTFNLPSEAQWEYACRAGTTTPLNNGKDLSSIDQVCWYGNNSCNTIHTVGQKKPNAWKIFDMHGNVWEWCEDKYGPYPNYTINDPICNKGYSRVCRGGSWNSNASDCRSAYRCAFTSGRKCDNLGFRVALVPIEQTLDL